MYQNRNAVFSYDMLLVTWSIRGTSIETIIFLSIYSPASLCSRSNLDMQSTGLDEHGISSLSKPRFKRDANSKVVPKIMIHSNSAQSLLLCIPPLICHLVRNATWLNIRYSAKLQTRSRRSARRLWLLKICWWYNLDCMV